MYTVFLAGGIASGKSTVARLLEARGAWRVDLDEVSRTVLRPGTACLDEVADAFGRDLLDPVTGELDRALLASRAFSSPERARELEDIELPHIRDVLVRTLAGECCVQRDPALCVVEVPLLDRVEGMVDLADEVLCVLCPLGLRRSRAEGRGMDPDDFDRRAANQPDDDYLRAHADHVIVNDGGPGRLEAAVDEWWAARGLS